MLSFLCSYCDLTFMTNSQLKEHIKKSHTENPADNAESSRMPIIDDLSLLMDVSVSSSDPPQHLELEEGSFHIGIKCP